MSVKGHTPSISLSVLGSNQNLEGRPRTLSRTSKNSRAASFSVNYLHLDPDKVLTAFGKYGTYQMLAYIVTNAVLILYAANMMVMPFIEEEPENFSCVLPQDKLDQNYTVLDKCTVRLPSGVNGTCGQGGGRWLMEEGHIHETYASEYGLLCEEHHSAEHGSSIFLLGGMLVIPIITQLSDMFGRRWTFLLPLWLAVCTSILSAFSPSYTLFLAGRFFSGVGASSYSTIGFILCMESVSVEFRSLIPLLGTVAWVVGYMLAGVMKLLISDWRWLYFSIAAPGLLTLPFMWFTPESLHWMITTRKDKGVRGYIRSSSRMNRVVIPLAECQADTPTEEGDVVKRTALDIFTSPLLVFHMLINCFILITMNGTYWALSLFSTDLSEDKMTGFFLSGIVELPAGLLALVLLHYCGRKTVSWLSLAFTSLSMVAALYFHDSAGLRMVFPLAAKVFNSVVWASQPLLYAEMTPTSIRNVFTGIVAFAGDIGSVLAPYLKRLEAINPQAPTLLIALMSLISAIFVLILPETKGRKLPEDIDDFDAGPLIEWLRGRKRKEQSRDEENATMLTAAKDSST